MRILGSVAVLCLSAGAASASNVYSQTLGYSGDYDQNATGELSAARGETTKLSITFGYHENYAIESAYLTIMVADDAAGAPLVHGGDCGTAYECDVDRREIGEIAVVRVNGEHFFAGNAAFVWYQADVTDLLRANRDLEVTFGGIGDYSVLGGSLAVHRGALVPEPSAALAFATGALVIGLRVRRSRGTR